jgi:1-acyl-sn-glycerol-3-phosphate acyltransferase
MAYLGVRQLLGPLMKLKIGEVRGTEHLPSRPPFIVAANHVGFLDAPALIMALYGRYKQPVHIITKQFIWKVWGGPLARKWVGMIPRRDGRQGEALIEAIDVLRHGGIVAIFPEGARHPDPNALSQGKTGAVRMALATSVPIVPVGIYNTTGQFIGRALTSIFHPNQKVSLTFGPPVWLTEFMGQPVDKPLLVAATRKLMKAIGVLCGKEYTF